jgi:DNA invertase Pin-like site-specific DNA recombinase
VERGELGGLVVAKVDRFSRDLAYGAMIARRIERAGGTFVAADDGVVIGPDGRDFGGNDAAHFLFAQLLSMADFFGRRIKRAGTTRSTATSTSAAATGARGRRSAIRRSRAKDGRLEPDPMWAPLVVEAFERRAQGEGCSTIARWLEARRAHRRDGRPTHRWVKDLLRTGSTSARRAPASASRGAHPALIDEGLFAAAQRQVGAAAPARRRSRRAGADRARALLGLPHGDDGRLHNGRQRVYRCRRFHSGGECPAPAGALEAELLELVEPIFWDVLGADARRAGVADDDGDGGSSQPTSIERGARSRSTATPRTWPTWTRACSPPACARARRSCASRRRARRLAPRPRTGADRRRRLRERWPSSRRPRAATCSAR